jgi:divalent metal cation (Fe/Co/Zn/Cd) transporter
MDRIDVLLVLVALLAVSLIMFGAQGLDNALAIG